MSKRMNKTKTMGEPYVLSAQAAFQTGFSRITATINDFLKTLTPQHFRHPNGCADRSCCPVEFVWEGKYASWSVKIEGAKQDGERLN